MSNPDIKADLEEQALFENQETVLSWTSGIRDKEQQLKLGQRLRANVDLFVILVSMIRTLYRTKRESIVDLDKGELPNRLIYWEGYRQAIEDVLKLLPKDQIKHDHRK